MTGSNFLKSIEVDAAYAPSDGNGIGNQGEKPEVVANEATQPTDPSTQNPTQHVLHSCKLCGNLVNSAVIQRSGIEALISCDACGVTYMEKVTPAEKVGWKQPDGCPRLHMNAGMLAGGNRECVTPEMCAKRESGCCMLIRIEQAEPATTWPSDQEIIDTVYNERNRLVAALARIFPAGLKKTAIEGWDPEWHNCVYIDTHEGQLSWHFHDREAHLFEGLPEYLGAWDGHTTEEKYRRLDQFKALSWPILAPAIVDDSDICSNPEVTAESLNRDIPAAIGEIRGGLSALEEQCEYLARMSDRWRDVVGGHGIASHSVGFMIEALGEALRLGHKILDAVETAEHLLTIPEPEPEITAQLESGDVTLEPPANPEPKNVVVDRLLRRRNRIVRVTRFGDDPRLCVEVNIKQRHWVAKYPDDFSAEAIAEDMEQFIQSGRSTYATAWPAGGQ